MKSVERAEQDDLVPMDRVDNPADQENKEKMDHLDLQGNLVLVEVLDQQASKAR